MTFSIARRDETPKLLEPGDYDALAEHFKRQNAEADYLGLRLFSPGYLTRLNRTGALGGSPNGHGR